MDIVEIISQYVNKDNNIINVEFITDDDDYGRQDTIEYNYLIEFGYETNNTLDSYYDDDGDWEMVNDEDNTIDEDTLVSFLSEYYMNFPDKIPAQDYC